MPFALPLASCPPPHPRYRHAAFNEASIRGARPRRTLNLVSWSARTPSANAVALDQIPIEIRRTGSAKLPAISCLGASRTRAGPAASPPALYRRPKTCTTPDSPVLLVLQKYHGTRGLRLRRIRTKRCNESDSIYRYGRRQLRVSLRPGDYHPVHRGVDGPTTRRPQIWVLAKVGVVGARAA